MRIVGGDAVVAAHGAAARGFDVEQAVGEIGIRVFGVGELEGGEIGERRMKKTTDGHGWTGIERGKDILTEGGKGEVAFAEEEKIGERKNSHFDRMNRIYRMIEMGKVGRSRRDRRAV